MIPSLFFISLITLFYGGEMADDFIIAENPPRVVPIFYVDEFNCSEDDTHTKGCYDPNADVILLVESSQYMHASTGCSIRQHEINHANGLHHGRDMPPSCSNPNDNSDTFGLYDPDNFFHFDPMYIWTGYGPTDPKCASWYLGERPSKCS